MNRSSYAPVLDRDGARALDEATIRSGVPSLRLMESAGEALCVVAHSELLSIEDIEPDGERRPQVLVLCGAGNNGGDGLVAARHLNELGVSVTVALCCGEFDEGGDAYKNFKRWKELGGETIGREQCMEVLSGSSDRRADMLIDALLGTGLNRELDDPLAELVDAINASGLPVVAADTPTGLCVNRGSALGRAVFADFTVCFGSAKPGLFLGDGPNHCGRVSVSDIGLLDVGEAGVEALAWVIDDQHCGETLPLRHRMVHKGELGHVLIVGGSRGKSGAALLAARGALRTGAGLVTVAAPATVADAINTAFTEAMTLELADRDGEVAPAAWTALADKVNDFDCIVIGPGLGRSGGAEELVVELLEHYAGPMVIDADALSAIARHRDSLARLLSRRSRSGAPAPVLTPHPGEMAALCGLSAREVQKNRLGLCRSFVTEHRVVLLLKGAATIVSDRDGAAFNLSGNPGMATAGMGDVLAGVIGTLLCQVPDGFEASAAAAYLHGFAADQLYEEFGGPGFLASEVADALPLAMAVLSHGKPRDQ